MGIFNVDALEKQLEKMQAKVDERTEIFESRSEKWQLSEKGEAYEYATSQLDSVANDLYNLIDEIKEIE